jgi:hypothetical protein
VIYDKQGENEKRDCCTQIFSIDGRWLFVADYWIAWTSLHTCEALFKWKKRRASISWNATNGSPL